MKIAVAGDSAGEQLANILAEHLADAHEVVRMSRREGEPFPYYANLAEHVANAIINGPCERAILVCGTGIGVCLSANKVPGIRAAQCHDTYSAERAALSNNAQIITLGARVVGTELAKSIVDSFLSHQFDPQGRSAANVEEINALDARHRRE